MEWVTQGRDGTCIARPGMAVHNHGMSEVSRIELTKALKNIGVDYNAKARAPDSTIGAFVNIVDVGSVPALHNAIQLRINSLRIHVNACYARISSGVESSVELNVLLAEVQATENRKNATGLRLA